MVATPPHPELIAQARRFLEVNCARKLGLAEVAEAVSLSATYLCRAFKKETGCGVVEYLTRLRVAKAQALLRDPALRVKEVAFASGFQSVAHFNRAFKKLTGVAPQEFRRAEGGSLPTADGISRPVSTSPLRIGFSEG